MNTKPDILRNTLRCIYPLILYLLIQEVFVILIMPACQNMLYEFSGSGVLSEDFEHRFSVTFAAISALVTLPCLLPMFRKDKAAGAHESAESGIRFIDQLFVILSGIFLCFGLSFLMSLFNPARIDPGYAEVQNRLFSGFLILQIPGIGIIVPAVEELLFRGLVQNRLRLILKNRLLSILLTAVLFAIFHGNLTQGIGAGVGSLFISYAYEKYKALHIPILMHISFNLTGVIMEAAAIPITSRPQILILGLISTAAAAVLVIIRKPDIVSIIREKCR